MNKLYDFDTLADRRFDKSKKWDADFIKGRYGDVPENYLSMWIADLDFELAPPIHSKFQEILDNKSFGYTYVYEDFYRAVQAYLKRKCHCEISSEAILLNYSIVSSLYHIVQTFAINNKKVIVNSPVYNPFRESCTKNGVRIIENELYIKDDGKYAIDFECLEAQIKKEMPDMYILCSPHNPGGRVWRKNELEEIAQICLDNNVLLVVDEAHSDHIYTGEFTSVLTLDDKYLTNLIYLNSPNKSFNIAGLKTSYVIILDPELRGKYICKMEENHVDEPNIFGIAGIVSAYTPEGFDWSTQCYDYIKDNYEWVQQFLINEMPELTLMPLEATYVAWINVSGTNMSGNEFTNKLASETGVLVQEGSSFGEAGKDYIRVNLGTSKENVIKAFSLIKNWLNK